MKHSTVGPWRLSITVLTLVAAGCSKGGDSPQSSAHQSCPLTSGSTLVSQTSVPYLQTTAKPLAGQLALKKLKSHVPHEVDRSRDQGRVADSQQLPITVSLALNNTDELVHELQELYRPGSPTYRKFLRPEEFRARFGPTAGQLSATRAFLEAQGLQAVTTDASGLVVHATGTVSALNSAFHTELHQYSDAQGSSYHAPHYELQVPSSIPIVGVHGLQDLSRARTHAQGPLTQSSAKGGHGPNGGFSPADVRQAYNLPTNLDGAGQTLALFELDGYAASDVAAYESKFGLNAVPLQNVLVDGYSGAVGSGQGEVTLDIELMIALAPGATKLLVYEGPNSERGIIDTYARIANDNLAASVSSSWGLSEDNATAAQIQAENNIFLQMAMQGQTVYSASGDTGAYDNGSTLSIDDPSGQPYVVAVGGTTLSTSASGAYVSETTWNNSSGAGGGGISAVWTIPNWQRGLIGSASKGSATMRNIPDVSLHADINAGYSIYVGGVWGNWGGTSCAAPLWAAFNALVNQQRALNGLGHVGYINPLLYAIGSSSRYGADFFDVRDNSTNKYFPAVTGLDNATGWGSFNAANLLQDLSQGDEGSTGSGSNPLNTSSCGG